MIIRARCSGGCALKKYRSYCIPMDAKRTARTCAFRDGWRTLRFFLMLSPRWTFLAPGVALGAGGLLGCSLVLMRVSLAGVVFDAHTLLVSMVAL